MPRAARSVFRFLRNLRWKTLRWSASDDQRYHDGAFQHLPHDPFSPGYVGSITIRRFADLAEPRLQDGSLVLDLGCGPGEITCELARRRPAVTFTGVDHSRRAVDVARGHAERLGLVNVEFVAGDVATYTPPRRAKLVMMFNAFHHLLDPAGFVGRYRALADDFLLIEPVGDVLGRWRESLDFDWVAGDLDRIRARIDHALGVEAAALPGGAAEAGGEPVEHRYTLEDFESFFEGFRLTVTGTVSGLNAYPPQLARETAWRRRFGEFAYQVYRALDEQLAADDRDVWGRHWVVYATPGGPGARRRPAPFPGQPPPGVRIKGAYDVAYGRYEGPVRTRAGATFHAEVEIGNEGFMPWSSDGATPVFVSYRWLTSGGVPVSREGRRARLPRALEPGGSCRVPLVVEAPERRGRYVLAIDLVHEGVTWFSEAGQVPLKVPFTVTR